MLIAATIYAYWCALVFLVGLVGIMGYAAVQLLRRWRRRARIRTWVNEALRPPTYEWVFRPPHRKYRFPQPGCFSADNPMVYQRDHGDETDWRDLDHECAPREAFDVSAQRAIDEVIRKGAG